MGLSEVLSDLIRIEQLKEIRRTQASRALQAPEAAGELFEQYPGRVAPEVFGEPEATGPNLSTTIQGVAGGPDVTTSLPGGYTRPPEVRTITPTQVPAEVEQAFSRGYGAPLSKFAGTRTPTQRLVSREEETMPVELEKLEKTSAITLKRQKELADYMKKIHPEREPGVKSAKTREAALFDDLYNIQNWHAEQMHMVRQDPRAQKDPEKFRTFSQEVNRTMMDKVRALENQYPDLIMKNDKAKKSVSRLKALAIISPIYPERKK